jgi:predicted RND superfamily exporter protein
MRKNKASRDGAVDRLHGVLLGAGPLRIRLSEFGRARRDKVVEFLSRTAHDALGLQLEIRDPELGPQAALATLDAGDANGDSSGESADDSTEPASSVAIGGPDAGKSLNDESAGNGGAHGANSEPAPLDEVPQCPPHDLVVVWRGMHWDAAKISAFKDLAVGLRLPSNRAGNLSPLVIEECFQVPGSPVALAVYLSEAGNADRPEVLRWLTAAAVQSGIPADSLHMGGSAVVGAALNREVLKSAWDKSAPWHQIHRRSIILLSGLVGGVLVLWLLKSFRLAGLVLGVSYYTTLVSTAMIPLTGGSMNMVLVVLPTLVLVTTLSVAIHVANYWRHARAGNINTAVAETVKAAFVPCLWAGLATLIGQASLLTSSVAPVREFGMYSAIGTLVALVVTLYGLPALLAIWPGKPPRRDEIESAFWQGLAGWIVKHRRLVMVVSLIAAGASLLGLKSFKTETKVIRYFADSTRTVQDYEYIEDRLAGIVPVDVIVRFDRESQQQLKFLQRGDLVREIQAGLEKLPDVSGSLSLADFLPTIVDPGDHGHVRERAKYSAASRTIETDIKGPETKASGSHRIGSRQKGSGGKNQENIAKSLLAVADDVTEFNAEGDELWLVTAQVAVMSQHNYQDLRSQIDEICSSVLRRTSGSAGDKVPPVGALRSYHPGASHFIAGELPLFLATQRELHNGFLLSGLAAYAAIGLIVMIALRHPLAGCLAMIPNVTALGAVFGLISWCGIPVDIGSTASLSIALGLTINGTLHLVNWFRLEIRQGKTRAEAVSLALGHCGPAMWQTTLVVSIGLAMLCPSDLISISRFGWLMAALLASASISELVLTPALLAGPLGYFIEKVELGSAVESQETKEPAIPKIEIPLPAPVPTATIPGKPHIGKKSVRIRRSD